MNNYDILRQIENIDNNNLFLSYIIDRIQDNDYRGIQCSQHNRLDFNYFASVIDVIYHFAGRDRFAIHVGDDDGFRQSGAELYYIIVKNLNRQVGKATVNSLKKNTFPDLARAGFLNRYNKEGNKISNTRSHIYEVGLSELGINFAESRTQFERLKYYTDAVDALTRNSATELTELLSTDDRFDYIDILEFMYILSDDRKTISYNDKINYLLEYRNLTNNQKDNVTRFLKMYCNPKNNTSGNKILSRDYHNWKNESQQIFKLFENSTYFKVLNDKLMLNNTSLGLFFQNPQRKTNKNEYFSWHNIAKRNNYELHHIIPFKKAISQYDAKFIDDTRNLIYLRSDKHSEFTALHNINVRTSYSAPFMLFLKLNGIDNIIKINVNTDEAIISANRINEMIEYNRKLLRKFYNIG